MPERSDRLRPATPADRDAVVATVVAAFDRDPAFRFFFGDDAFAANAALFAGGLFDRRVARDAVWVVDDGDAMAPAGVAVAAVAGAGVAGAGVAVAAVAMWEPPGGPEDDDVDVIPDDARARLGAWDRAVHHLMPTDRHWYLGILATHPRRAGEGLGRLVAQPGLVAAGTDGCDAWLETATAANVAMYTRRGWQVAGEAEVAGVTATVMRHLRSA